MGGRAILVGNKYGTGQSPQSPLRGFPFWLVPPKTRTPPRRLWRGRDYVLVRIAGVKYSIDTSDVSEYAV